MSRDESPIRGANIARYHEWALGEKTGFCNRCGMVIALHEHPQYATTLDCPGGLNTDGKRHELRASAVWKKQTKARKKQDNASDKRRKRMEYRAAQTAKRLAWEAQQAAKKAEEESNAGPE